MSPDDHALGDSRKEPEKRGNNGLRRIFLYDMTCARDNFQARPRNFGRKLATIFDRNPLVLLAPQDHDGAADLVVSGFDLISIFLVELGDLPPESRLAELAKPWFGIQSHCLRQKRLVDSARNVCRDDCPMHKGW